MNFQLMFYIGKYEKKFHQHDILIFCTYKTPLICVLLIRQNNPRIVHIGRPAYYDITTFSLFCHFCSIIGFVKFTFQLDFVLYK